MERFKQVVVPRIVVKAASVATVALMIYAVARPFDQSN